ncbi:MAG: RAMP superfamily CRISPR-associated protein [Methylovulum sp.]
MTHFLDHYTLRYTPLSPVHIGTDESYEPGNYVIDDEGGALYSFNSQAAVTGLGEKEKKELLTIVNGRPDDLMLTKVQAFFHKHRAALIAYANSPVPTAHGINDLYEKRIGKTAQHEGHGKRVINKLEIERTFYNPVDGKPMLPGSSIKGAIRTALLDDINDGKRLINSNEKNQALQQRLLEGKFHTDPFRLVSIGDASWQGSQNKPASQIKFAVNRKRKPVSKDGQLVKSQAEANNLYQLLECVTPQHYQSFTGALTLLNTGSINPGNSKLPKQDFHWSIKEIAKACNEFYKGLFWQEYYEIKERGYLNAVWLEQLKDLIDNDLAKRLDEGEVFLLRVGRHSGAEALTLNGIRNIKIMQGRGQPAAWASQPKTWWLAADESNSNREMLPFGWVLVEINPTEVNTKLQNWLESSHDKLTTWMQTQVTKQDALKEADKERQEKLLAIKQKELDDALKAEKAAAEAELKRQEEAARLAQLPQYEQDIAEILKAKKDPNKKDYLELIEAVKKGQWEEPDRQLVLEAIKARMQELKEWRPTTNKKDPTKDKEYTRTIEVIKLMGLPT